MAIHNLRADAYSDPLSAITVGMLAGYTTLAVLFEQCSVAARW